MHFVMHYWCTLSAFFCGSEHSICIHDANCRITREFATNIRVSMFMLPCMCVLLDLFICVLWAQGFHGIGMCDFITHDNKDKYAQVVQTQSVIVSDTVQLLVTPQSMGQVYQAHWLHIHTVTCIVNWELFSTTKSSCGQQLISLTGAVFNLRENPPSNCSALLNLSFLCPSCCLAFLFFFFKFWCITGQTYDGMSCWYSLYNYNGVGCRSVVIQGDINHRKGTNANFSLTVASIVHNAVQPQGVAF